MAAAVLLQLFGAYCGFLLTDDSRNYLSAANSFSSRGLFLSPDGTVYVAWPPLFPVILSFFADPLQAMLVVNIILKSAIAILLYIISGYFISNFFLRAVFLIVTLLGTHLTMISVFLWSELLFVFLLLLLFFIVIGLRHIRSYTFLLIVVSFLLCLQRNVGVFFVIAISAGMLIDGTSRRKVTVAMTYLLLSMSGITVWLFYIISVSNDFSFSAYHFLEDPLYNVSHILQRVGKLFVPGPAWLTIAMGIVVVATSISVVKNKIRKDSNSRLLILISATYLGGLIAVGKLNVHDLDRLLSPIVPFIYLLVFFAVDQLRLNYKDRAIRIALIAIFLWASYPLARTWQNLQLWNAGSCSGELNK